MCRTIHSIDVSPARGDHGSHAVCRYRRYRVYWPARGVARSWRSRDDAEVWVLVRRESLGRFERLASDGDHPWGERAKPLVGDLTAPSLGLTDDAIAELGTVDHVVHCAAIYDITAAEDDQRAANVEGTRAVIDLALRLDATLAPRVVDRGRRHLPGRVHRGRLRRGAGSAHAVSPDEVRGRACWSARRRGCSTASTGRRSSSATRAPVRWTRSTGPTTSSAYWPSWRACPGSRRWCCPTPGAPTSFRSTL